MKKIDRQLLIKEIIMSEDMMTQEDLLKALERYGVNATQATISRDIKELNLVKTASANGGSKYTIFKHENPFENARLEEKIQSVVSEVNRVEFMNIVKTLPGNAHVLGAIVDEMDNLPILGSVAGNDTILLISKDVSDAEDMYGMIDRNIKKEG